MSSSMARGQRRAAGMFLAPYFILFAAFTLAPLAYAGWLSLFTEKTSGLGFGGITRSFSGLANYVHALDDPAFRGGFITVAAYVVLYVPIMIGSALVVALLLDSGLALARRFCQVALFIPHAVPGLIAALIWLYLYTPGLSPVVGLFGRSNVTDAHPLLSVVNIAVWEWMGYNVVIFYAALQAVPEEVVEAATIDGAGGAQIALRVKVPMIRPAVAMAALFTVIGGVQLFSEPKILGPVSAAITDTWTPNLYTQDAAFTRNDFGLASASSVLIALTAALLSYAVTKIAGRRSRA